MAAVGAAAAEPSTPTSPNAAALRESTRRWLGSHAWPPAKASRLLNSEKLRSFQENYREYRRGWAKGARGEITDIIPAAVHERLKAARADAVTTADAGDDGAVAEPGTGGAAGGAHLSAASGAFLSAPRSPYDASKSPPLTEYDDPADDFADSADVIFDCGGAGGGDPELIALLERLNCYRSSYRKFRTGASRGAEGEIFKFAHHFTRDQLRLLPVGQLATCLAQRVHREAAEPARVADFHVHIGAGRLGCGLVIPTLIRSNRPFCVLQNIAEEWVCVWEASSEYLEMSVNGERLCRLRVIRQLSDLDPSWLVTDPATKKVRFVPPRPPCDVDRCRLLNLNVELNPLFLAVADAFSCSLGPALPAVARFVAASLPTNSGTDRAAIYCCENDHGAVDAVRPLLEAKVNVRECMVDRICSDRPVTPTTVEVVTEPYEGEIVVTNRYAHSVLPAFAGANVRIPKTGGAYAYLYNRKFLLVNGTHTTLAFITLRRECSATPEIAPGDFALVDPAELPPEELREVRAWTLARCLMLLHAHDFEVVKSAHNVTNEDELADQLWNFAQRTITRFSTVKDSTKRVLGGGVTNRYQTRLRQVADTLDTFDGEVPLKARLMRLAGVASVAELKATLAVLVRDAYKFAYPAPETQPTTGETPAAGTVVNEYAQQFKAAANVLSPRRSAAAAAAAAAVGPAPGAKSSHLNVPGRN